MKRLIIVCTVFLLTMFVSVLNVESKEYETDGNVNHYFNYVSTYDDSYYSSLSGLSGDDFRAELNDIITEDFVWYTYDSSNRYMILREADALYDDEYSTACIYTGKIFSIYDNGTSGTDIWNTEHVWAKSHGFPSDKQLPYSDYHHLRICEGYTNTVRNNRDFADLSDFDDAVSDEWGNKRVSGLFEPRDSVKGDVARMLLYMDVRYDGEHENDVDLVLVEDQYTTSSDNLPYMGNLSTLLRWHEEDPVDDRERRRNDIIYSYQKNRNPFVDHPEYANMIWGDAVDNELEEILNFDLFIENIDSNITINSQQDIAIGFVLYNKLSAYQKECVSMYTTLQEYYVLYLEVSGYTESELKIIFEFYDDYCILNDVLNGNFYDLESYL